MNNKLISGDGLCGVAIKPIVPMNNVVATCQRFSLRFSEECPQYTCTSNAAVIGIAIDQATTLGGQPDKLLST